MKDQNTHLDLKKIFHAGTTDNAYNARTKMMDSAKNKVLQLMLLGISLFSTASASANFHHFCLEGDTGNRVLAVPPSLLPPGGDSTRYNVSWYFARSHGARVLSLDGIEPLCFEDRGYCDSLYTAWLHLTKQKDTLRATWFDGVLENLIQPIACHSDRRISPYLHRYTVEKGVLQNRETLQREGYFFKKRHMARGYRPVLDGHWKEQFPYEMALFADSVNALMATADCPDGDSVLAVCFRCDEQGALSVEPYGPQALTENDRHVLSYLQQSLTKLPPFALTLFYTSAGELYNERLMKGYYRASEGWTFCDELQQEYTRFSPPEKEDSGLLWMAVGTCVLLVGGGIVFAFRRKRHS